MRKCEVIFESSMVQYRLFFSWQNDRKDTKVIINAALKKAKNKLKVEGVDLFIDQDTRERVGMRNIDAEVLEKIHKCDIFVADLTPVITYIPSQDSLDLPKHMPNSNVMYEYGYALHAKGENRMIVLASLDKTENEHIEYMPFDINHDTITLFTDEDSLGGLTDWIRKIIVDVDQERAAYVPQYACTLLFRTEEDFSDEITIHPRYKRICYIAKSRSASSTATLVPQYSIAEVVSNSFKLQEALLNRLNVVPTSSISVKVIHKTTNLSYVPIQLVFVNQGSEALDNLHISIKASDDRVKFDDTNVDEKWGFPRVKSSNSTFASDDGISQNATTLNPQASVKFEEVFVHAPHDIESFKLIWQLSSRTYQANGKLIIHVESDYESDLIENDELAGTEKVIDLEISD